MIRIKSRLLLAAFLGVAWLAAQAQTQAPTARYTTIMVPYATGGPADAVARIVNGPLGQQLGTTVVVDNLGGAGGTLGAQKTLSEPPDGRFLLQGSPNEVILAPAVNPAVKLRVEDFTLVHPLAEGVLVLVAKKDLPVHNADELIALARQREKNPLGFGSVGIGSLNHLILEQIQRDTGTRFMHVPYKGSAPLMQDLAGGQIDVAVLVYSGSLGGMIEAGNIKLLGQFGAQRSPLLRNVPTVSEGTQLKRMSFSTWAGLMVRKDTPLPILQQLNRAIAAVLQQPQVRENLAVQSLAASPPTSLEDASKFFQSEIDQYRAMLATINIKIQ